MPVAVLMLVKEKAAVSTTGTRKNKTMMTSAGAMSKSPSDRALLTE